MSPRASAAHCWQWGTGTRFFWFLALYALGVIPLQAWVVLRHARPTANTHQTDSLLTRYRFVFGTRSALPFIALQAFAFSVMMLFITHSSFIYQAHFQAHFGQLEGAFSLMFGANIAVMLLVNLTNRALLNRFSSCQILVTCLSVQFVGVLLLSLTTWAQASVWLFLPAMMLTIGAQSGIVPNNQACFMEHFEHHDGTASSLLGACQFDIAGGLSAFSTLLPETLGWVIASMFACSLVCISVILFVLRPRFKLTR